VTIPEVDKYAGQLSEKQVPKGTYSDGKGISLFTGRQIPKDYIVAKAMAGQMGSTLYAVAVKTPHGLEFRAPVPAEIGALLQSDEELARPRPGWEKNGILPTEEIPPGDQPGNCLAIAGIRKWADAFTPRQLVTAGTVVEELQELRSEIIGAEGVNRAAAIEAIFALSVDKLLNHNSILARFENTRLVIKGVFGRHGYEFHATFTEMAVCNGGMGDALRLTDPGRIPGHCYMAGEDRKRAQSAPGKEKRGAKHSYPGGT
jgi:adenine-specific DNA methylase